MDKAEAKEVLKTLLELIAGYPEVAKRIIIVIEPSKVLEDGSQKPK